MKIAIIIAAAILILAFLLIRRKTRTPSVPAVGAAAPDFTLNSQLGTPVSLGELHGQWVVLYFYPKDLTPGCTIEARNFQRDLSKYEDRNAVILGVSTQDESSHRQFCAKEGLHFKLLADVDRKVSAAYGSLADYLVTAMSARKTFLINPDGKIARVYETVNIPPHSEELLHEIDNQESSRTATRKLA
jgi:peroxiredoxin Q/BCP